jgi:hypothetical protein
MDDHNTNRPTIEEQRARVSPEQRALLDQFWKHFQAKGTWPLARVIYSPNRTKKVREALKLLTGNIVREERDSRGRAVFALSLLGVVLTSEGETCQKLVERYLKYQRKLFQTDPEKDMVTGPEVTTALGLDANEVILLGQLINGRNNSWDAAARRDSNWSVQVMTESEFWSDLDKALEDWVMPYYKADAAVFEEDRRREMYSDGAKRSLSLTDVVSSQFVESRKVANNAEDNRLQRRYQVFVSSTYKDLVEERQHVLWALLEMRCIPSGMEMFPAANDAKWDLIRKQIDDCDYFVVIVAGKYGNPAMEGKSFTELEYDHAFNSGKPIMGFFYDDIRKLRAERVEEDDEGKRRLAKFTEKVKAEKMCRAWNSADGLASAVKSAILNAMTSTQTPGWVRADAVPNWGLVNQLENRIAELEERKKPNTSTSA